MNKEIIDTKYYKDTEFLLNKIDSSYEDIFNLLRKTYDVFKDVDETKVYMVLRTLLESFDTDLEISEDDKKWFKFVAKRVYAIATDEYENTFNSTLVC